MRYLCGMKIVECPRDAMQGIESFIPTSHKIRYINQLLKVGFDTIDFGSFVSAKAIPQMRDTSDVLTKLAVNGSSSKLLAIVANVRGAEEACAFPTITYLGYPLSISETFQKRNTNASITEALDTMEVIKGLCNRNGKKLVAYMSMGFGNPYGDPYSPELVLKFTNILVTMGVDVVSLADTIGVADANSISTLFTSLTRKFPNQELGVHLHSIPETAGEKIRAALQAGCRRFDGAIHGWGGCPMAKDKLVGNIATEAILEVLNQEGTEPGINHEALQKAQAIADEIFPAR